MLGSRQTRALFLARYGDHHQGSWVADVERPTVGRDVLETVVVAPGRTGPTHHDDGDDVREPDPPCLPPQAVTVGRNGGGQMDRERSGRQGEVDKVGLELPREH